MQSIYFLLEGLFDESTEPPELCPPEKLKTIN